MASLNKFIGIGNLTKDPETRYLPNGDAVTSITIACNESWKDKNGAKQEKAEFIRVVFYRKLAEIVGEYLKKGRSVYVEGRLETKKYTDKQGIERYITQIVAEDMKMLGSNPNAKPGDNNQPTPSNAGAGDGNDGGFDGMDDIPF